jgi:hypothetical protein
MMVRLPAYARPVARVRMCAPDGLIIEETSREETTGK